MNYLHYGNGLLLQVRDSLIPFPKASFWLLPSRTTTVLLRGVSLLTCGCLVEKLKLSTQEGVYTVWFSELPNIL